MYDAAEEPDRALRTFLQENIEPLQGIVRSYVARTGLAQGDAIQNVALDVIGEATLEALKHSELFRTVRQPRAWFLGIVANIIKRRRRTLFRQSQRELPVATLVQDDTDGSESDFFDQISLLTHPSPEQEVETRAQVAELLAQVSPEDQQVLRLAFLQDLDTYNLALTLKIPPGTARVRLHRALHRLRSFWQARNAQQERGSHA